MRKKVLAIVALLTVALSFMPYACRRSSCCQHEPGDGRQRAGCNNNRLNRRQLL